MVKKQNLKKEIKNIISASEIGQYYFCSNSWFLQKNGYIPISKKLDTGNRKHEELGIIIHILEKQMKKARLITLTAYVLFFISIIILLIGVIF
ncbi:MAG: hypothetical protein JSV67_07975 [Thermoplasmatales archaeon]|nr:MAG: hypothetical protein JSV67_07975 [Thermoplasmatales archaeon]